MPCRPTSYLSTARLKISSMMKPNHCPFEFFWHSFRCYYHSLYPVCDYIQKSINLIKVTSKAPQYAGLYCFYSNFHACADSYSIRPTYPKPARSHFLCVLYSYINRSPIFYSGTAVECLRNRLKYVIHTVFHQTINESLLQFQNRLERTNRTYCQAIVVVRDAEMINDTSVLSLDTWVI